MISATDWKKTPEGTIIAVWVCEVKKNIARVVGDAAGVGKGRGGCEYSPLYWGTAPEPPLAKPTAKNEFAVFFLIRESAA